MRTALLALLMFAPAHAAVPSVVSGPATADEAEVIEAPIEAVTVFSDRARIVRTGKASAGSGTRAIRLPDLPGAVRLDTLRVTAKGAKVLRVEATPVRRNRRSIDQVEGLLNTLTELSDARRLLLDQRSVLSRESQLLDAVYPAPLPAEDKRRTSTVRLRSWTRVLDFLDARRADVDARSEQISLKIKTIEADIAKTTAEVKAFDSGAFSDRRVQVVVLLNAQTERPTLTVEYFMTGASWRPQYKVELTDTGRKLSIRSAAQISQATGEDWDNVRLALSTAIPGQNIELPELLTWTLGESRKFVPKPRARTTRNTGALTQPTARATLEDRLEQQTLSLLKQRFSQARADQDRTASEESQRRQAEAAAHARLRVRERKRAEAERVQITAARREMAARDAPPPAAPPSMMSDDVEGAPRSASAAVSRPTVGLNLFETVPATSRLTDPSLPAVAAGGLDYVYKAVTRVSVPSGPERHHVPLAARTYPIDAFYEATPSLKKTAFLRAKVTNKSDQPLLAGPVDIFVGADFVGQGTLATTGSGGEIEFPLGADEDIRFERRVLPKTETEGLFSKEDLTRYTVQIDVANYKRRPVVVRVADLVPKSTHESVSIKLGKLTPAPAEGPDADGVVVFELKLAAGAKQTIEFDYTIRRPADWQLRQY